MSLAYGKSLVRIRWRIFHDVIETVGQQLPGLLVCVLYSNQGVHIITSKYLLVAMNIVIARVVSEAFANMPSGIPVMREQSGPMRAKIRPHRQIVEKMITSIYSADGFHDTHCLMLYYNSNDLTYMAYTEDFPLSKARIWYIADGIFKTWMEMRTLDHEHGEIKFHADLMRHYPGEYHFTAPGPDVHEPDEEQSVDDD